MKKLSFLLFVAVIATVSVKAQEGWVKQELDEKASIKFPKTPEPLGPMFRLKDSDSSTYVSGANDLSIAGLDSATLAQAAGTEDFLEQIKATFAAQAPGLEITKASIGNWGKYPAFIMEGDVKEKKMKSFITTVFVGTKMYILIAGVPEALPLKNKEAFFASFVIAQ